MFVLLILSLLLINDEIESPRNHASYMVTVTWEKSDCDVDLWAKYEGLRTEVVCGFSARERPPFILQNDHTTNYNYDEKLAVETMIIKGRADGTYRFSLFPYNIRDNDEVSCKVVIHQITPFKTIYQDTVTVSGSSETVFLEFELEDNKLLNIETEDLGSVF